MVDNYYQSPLIKGESTKNLSFHLEEDYLPMNGILFYSISLTLQYVQLLPLKWTIGIVIQWLFSLVHLHYYIRVY